MKIVKATCKPLSHYRPIAQIEHILNSPPCNSRKIRSCCIYCAASRYIINGFVREFGIKLPEDFACIQIMGEQEAQYWSYSASPSRATLRQKKEVTAMKLRILEKTAIRKLIIKPRSDAQVTSFKKWNSLFYQSLWLNRSASLYLRKQPCQR